MKCKFLKSTFLLLFLGVGLFCTHAQESVVSSGGDAAGSDGSVNYTVGQTVYASSSTEEGSLSAGVQQPYEFFVVSSADETVAVDIDVNAYPNPTVDQVTLNTKTDGSQNLSFRLFDLEGKLLEQQEILQDKQVISMQHLAPGTYVLKVMQDDDPVKTFKIIKNE